MHSIKNCTQMLLDFNINTIMKNIALTKEIMLFSRKEIGEMIKQVERNPKNEFLKSIVWTLQLLMVGLLLVWVNLLRSYD